ncbi:MAG: hypothetical protein WBW14_09555, partial [Candidatus Acidiferrum sp.]
MRNEKVELRWWSQVEWGYGDRKGKFLRPEGLSYRFGRRLPMRLTRKEFLAMGGASFALAMS